MAMLYGPDGSPIAASALRREQAAPDLTGVRTVWRDPVATNLTPGRLARILRDAADGDMLEFLTLAEEIEEREAHYFSVLSTRKRALSELAPKVVAASEEAREIEIADAVRELVDDPRFSMLTAELTDALGKGYCVVEIGWDTSDGRWRPAEYHRRDPAFFQFDRRTGAELRLRSPAQVDGEQLGPYRFIVHLPRLKSGLPGRGGLARFAVWAFMLKSYALKDWMAFLEVFGMPVRLGKFGVGATEDEKEKLLTAVRDIAADAAAIIPASMSIDFVQASAKATDAYERKARYLDQQLSKIVLGQTTTTDAISGGHAVSKEHNEVRHDILRSDARVLAATLQRDLIEPFVAFNYGPQAVYPRLSLPVEEPEDTKELIEIVEKFVKLGGKVGMAHVRDRLGFEDPGEEEELLSAGTQPARPEPPAPVDPAPAAPATARFRCEDPALAREAEGGPADDSAAEIDALVDEMLGDWEPIAGPLVDPLRKAVEQASDYEDLRRRLADAAQAMDPGALTDALAIASMRARGLGDTKD